MYTQKFNFRLEPADYVRIRDHARATQQSTNHVIRQWLVLLSMYLDNQSRIESLVRRAIRGLEAPEHDSTP